MSLYAFTLALGLLIQPPAAARVQAAMFSLHLIAAPANSLSASSTSNSSATAAIAPVSQEKPPAGSSGGSGQTCLNSNCHGPFEKLASAKPSYALDGGKKINQHKYVPHDQKDESGIPKCTSCHQAHPFPPSQEGLAKPNLERCYSECHHMRDFTPCKECH